MEADLIQISQEEKEANKGIDDLIVKIQSLTERKNPLVKNIKSMDQLKSSMIKLRNMVEMISIKKSIISQIQFLLVNLDRQKGEVRNVQENTNQKVPGPKDTEAFEGHMIHTVLSGNPGTGKTTVGLILANIWSALGLIKTPKNKEPNYQEDLKEENIALRKKLFGGSVRLVDESCRIDDLIADLESYKNQWVKSGQSKRRRIKQEVEEVQGELTEIQNELLDIFSERVASIPEKDKETPVKFVVASREDLVGKYIGHTAILTKKILEEARGGVLFIDEAYSLVSEGSKNDFGHECLTVINEYMSKYPEELVVIFAGYKEKLDQTIFKSQPGLARRCSWNFEIQNYSPEGLARILSIQLAKTGWKIAQDLNLIEEVKNHLTLFPDFGGSTEKFVFYCKLAYGEVKFNEIFDSTEQTTQDSIITKEMFDLAMSFITKNSRKSNKISSPPIGMYM